MLHLVEAVLGRIGVGLVAQVPLAGEVGRVAVLLEEFGDRRRFLVQGVRIAGGDHDRERRADRNPSGDERGAAGRAARLAVPVREDRALRWRSGRCSASDGRGPAAAGHVTEVVPAGVVGHQDDIRPLGRCLRIRWQRRRRSRPLPPLFLPKVIVSMSCGSPL